MSWFSRIANVFRGGAVDRELDEERRFHLDSRIDALMRDGLTREAATQQAMRQFGRPLALREASRDVKLMPWLDALVRDIRFGLRLLRKDAIVALAAIASLALAIGACIAAFSLVDALILRPLPVREPQSLVCLAGGDDPGARGSLFTYPHFEQLRDTTGSGVDLFAMSLQSMTRATLSHTSASAGAGDGASEIPTRVQFVSGSAFRILGISSAMGRVLTPDDDRRAGDHPVAVISHGYWTRVVGRDGSALGRWIRFGGQDFQIVGVADEGFTGTEPGFLTDVWVPMMMWIRPGQTHQVALANNQAYWLRVWGRMQLGADLERARAVLQGRFMNYQREISSSRFKPDEPRERIERFLAAKLYVQPASQGVSNMRQTFERPLLVLTALVALVLLIACSNVANLLIARSAAREHELMLRASLGASRWRLAQQALVESGLLVAAACVVGLLFARAAAPLLVSMLQPSDSPVYLDLRTDWRVLAFVGALGLLTTILFGLGPARRAATVAPLGVGGVGGGGRTAMSGARQSSRIGFLRPLIAAQIAFSLTTLFVAGLLLMSFDKLTRVDLGLSAPNLLTVDVDMQPEIPAARAASVRRAILDRVHQIAGVESASLSRFPLLRRNSWGVDVRLPGRAPETFMPSCLSVTPGFFRTMGIRLIEGREFTPADAENPDPETPSGVVVNEAFLRRYFPEHASPDPRTGRSALGLRFGRVRATVIPQEVIGVVADAKYADVRGAAPPTIYVPHREPAGALQVRTRMEPAALASILRRELPRIDASLEVDDVMRQSTLVDNLLLRERLLALLSGFFALVGIVLAAVGLYGVVSYAVVRRTREIGIRLALGAPRVVVVRSVLFDIALMTVIGVAAGLAGGLFLSRFVRTLLYEVQPLDISSLVLPTASLLIVGVLATLVPARRALGVNPIVALRSE